MNIFATSPDPVESARALDDRRLNKMIVESAQILCTSLHLNGLGTSELYRVAYAAHPVVKWASSDPRHYAWLFRHFTALLDERRFRTAKTDHGCRRMLPALLARVTTTEPPATFVNCTPYKDERDVHLAYRMTLAGKWAKDARPPTWLKRGPPEFLRAVNAPPQAPSPRSAAVRPARPRRTDSR